MERLTNVKVIIGNDKDADLALMQLAASRLLVNATLHTATHATWVGGQLKKEEVSIIEGVTLEDLIGDIETSISEIGGKLSSACSITSESRRMLEFARMLRSGRYERTSYKK
jgi:hypothetical protein